MRGKRTQRRESRNEHRLAGPRSHNRRVSRSQFVLARVRRMGRTGPLSRTLRGRDAEGRVAAKAKEGANEDSSGNNRGNNELAARARGYADQAVGSGAGGGTAQSCTSNSSMNCARTTDGQTPRRRELEATVKAQHAGPRMRRESLTCSLCWRTFGPAYLQARSAVRR